MEMGEPTSDGECTVQCADDVLQNCTRETYILSLICKRNIFNLKRANENTYQWILELSAQTPPPNRVVCPLAAGRAAFSFGMEPCLSQTERDMRKPGLPLWLSPGTAIPGPRSRAHLAPGREEERDECGNTEPPQHPLAERSAPCLLADRKRLPGVRTGSPTYGSDSATPLRVPLRQLCLLHPAP